MAKINKAQKGTKFPGPPRGVKGLYPSNKAVAKTKEESKRLYGESKNPKLTVRWNEPFTNKPDSASIDTTGYSQKRKYFPTNIGKWATRRDVAIGMGQSKKKHGGKVHKTSSKRK